MQINVREEIRKYGMLIAFIVIMGLFAVLTSGMSLTPLNITNIVLQNSYILILAIGMLLVIVTGNIDLSVGSLAAFVGAVAAYLVIELKLNTLLSVSVAIGVGALAGLLQGYLIAYLKVPSFIATLGGMLTFRGLTMVLLQGKTLAPFPDSIRAFSSNFIPDYFANSSLHITTIVISIILSAIYVLSCLKNRTNKINLNINVEPMAMFIGKIAIVLLLLNIFSVVLAMYKGIPIILIALFALALIYNYITDKTIFGRHIYAYGGNTKAAILSGIKTKKVIMLVFMNMGLLAAISGIAFAARLNAATPKAGNGFELDAIAACFIGGASASGGVGKVIGALIGGLVMGVMNNGMSILGIGIDWQQAIKGIVLVLAVIFDVYTKSGSSERE